jgi:Tol biopolymer transport system component/imidazolonepropionase-like amidohydrolase
MLIRSADSSRTQLAIVALCICAAQSLVAGNSVTVREGTNFAADISPATADGSERTLVMDLQGMLWLVPAEGGKAKRLTGPEDDIRLPRYSPDGRHILFQSFRFGRWSLAYTDATANNRQELTAGYNDFRDPVWSASGKSIYFSADSTGDYEIWSMQLDTRELSQITRNAGDDYSPATSTQGKLAFVSEMSGSPAIHLHAGAAAIIDYETHAGTRELYRAPAGKLSGLRFSPDGKQLAFVQARERIAFPAINRNELVLLTIATGEHQVLSNNEDVFPVAPTWIDADTLVYTADGLIRQRSLAEPAASTIPFKARLNLQKSNLEQSLPNTFRQDEQPVLGIVNPVAMPDGNQVIFEALGDLWARTSDGKAGRLTDDRYAERDANISTNGRWLTYISDRSGSMQIWMRDAGAGTDTLLTTNARGPRYPTFNKDGSSIAWQDVGPIGTKDFSLNVLNLLTGKNRRLRHAPLIWPGAMSWSADDEYITVAELHSNSSRFRDGKNRLVRVAVNSEQTFINEIPGGGIADFGPVSSPDGTLSALILAGQLHVAPTNEDGSFSGPPQRVAEGLADSPSWSNDGERLTYLSATGLAQVAGPGASSEALPVSLSWRNTRPQGKTIVHAGRLYNGMSRNYRSNVDIEIENGMIVSVKRHRRHPDRIRVIDARKHTVLPGLIDHHGHFQPHQGEWVGRAWLAFGVTTVVEPGGIPWQSRSLMETWGSGRRPGPRLVFSGPQLDGYLRSFPFASHVVTDERLELEMQRARYLGYSALKTYVRMTPTRQQLAIESAHKMGIPVTAHSAFRNLAFGGDRVEHLRGTSRLGYSSKQSGSQKAYADIIAMISENGTAITPTVVVAGGFFSYLLANPELINTQQLTALYPESYRKGLLGFAKMMGRNDSLLAYGHSNALQSIARLHEQGARIVAGTDSPIFPYGLALIIELINYQQAGLEPWEVLETATSGAAQALGAADVVGSIRKAHVADLLIVDGDPLSNIADLMNVQGVMRNGNYYGLQDLLNPDQPAAD